ncbi:hypothetical protein MSG66_04315, partial [Acinetobacter sp. IK31]|nr:hypothetical protein [Acinetobacter sp. IK31]
TSAVEDTDTSAVEDTDTSDANDTESLDEDGTAATTSGQPGTTQDPNKRKYLVTSKLIACISDNTLRRVYGELRKIEIDENPLAVMLVARAFLEGIYIRYYENILGLKYDKNIKMHIVLQKVCDSLNSKRNDLKHSEVSALAVLKKLPSDQNKIFAAGNLGLYAHAVEYPSNKKQIIIEWDNISAIVQYMLIVLYKADQ